MSEDDLQAHLESGATTAARAWALTRADGVVMGFTDHDRPLSFEGITFRADSGLTARMLEQGTGLSVDNTEAIGALSDAGLTEVDILAGLYDGAGLRIWLVNWADVAQRRLLFRGALGELTRTGGAFRAELRGLSEALGRPRGRIFQSACDAVLGDAACGVDLTRPGMSAEPAVETVEQARIFRFAELSGFADRWFERGRLRVLTGAAKGQSAAVKNDRLSAAGRMVELWQRLGATPAPGDVIRLEPGCDKRVETCRLKFDNIVNFRGFPDIPEEDWLLAGPRPGGANTGGSRGSRGG